MHGGQLVARLSGGRAHAYQRGRQAEWQERPRVVRKANCPGGSGRRKRRYSTTANQSVCWLIASDDDEWSARQVACSLARSAVPRPRRRASGGLAARLVYTEHYADRAPFLDDAVAAGSRVGDGATQQFDVRQFGALSGCGGARFVAAHVSFPNCKARGIKLGVCLAACRADVQHVARGGQLELGADALSVNAQGLTTLFVLGHRTIVVTLVIHTAPH
jgi:hypothetical protein